MICLSFRTFTVNIVKLLAFNNLKNYFIYSNVMFFVSPDYKTSIFQFPEQYSFLYSFLSFPFFYFLFFIIHFSISSSLLSDLLFRLKQTKPTHCTAPPPQTHNQPPAILHKPTTPHSPHFHKPKLRPSSLCSPCSGYLHFF